MLLIIFKKLIEFKLPLILVAEIIACLWFGDMVPPTVKSALYSLSLLLKDILITTLPFIIFSILCANLSSLSKGAFLFTVMAFSCVILSNLSSTLISGTLGTFVLNTLTVHSTTSNTGMSITPLWALSLWDEVFGTAAPYLTPDAISNAPLIKQIKWVTNDMGLMAGIICGLALAMYPNQAAPTIVQRGVQTLHKLAFGFFRRFFIPVLPLFILGYILNMEQLGILDTIFENYAGIVAMITIFVFSYIIILYGIASGFKAQKWISSLKNLIPAALTGFSTMSSASALPLVIEGVKSNALKINKDSAASPYSASSTDDDSRTDTVTGIVPLSINIHLIGDCFAIPILALTILVSFGMELPSVLDFLIFTVFFVFAKFAVAAVPGGGILVMIPILESYLGFTPEMISLITALYILFDPIITAANIFGNGAFAGLFDRIFRFYQEVLFQKVVAKTQTDISTISPIKNKGD